MQLLLLLLLLIKWVRQRGVEGGRAGHSKRMWPVGAWRGASVAF